MTASILRSIPYAKQLIRVKYTAAPKQKKTKGTGAILPAHAGYAGVASHPRLQGAG